MNISFFPFMQVTVIPYRHKFLSLEFMYTILSMILFKSSITLSENKINSNDHLSVMIKLQQFLVISCLIIHSDILLFFSIFEKKNFFLKCNSSVAFSINQSQMCISFRFLKNILTMHIKQHFGNKYEPFSTGYNLF